MTSGAGDEPAAGAGATAFSPDTSHVDAGGAPQPRLLPLEYETAGRAWVHERVNTLAAQIHPLIGQVSRVKVRDLPAPETPAGEEPGLRGRDFRSIKFGHDWTSTTRESVTFDVDALLAKLFQMADANGSELSRVLLEMAGDAAESVGNVIDTAGRDLWEGLIEAMEKVDFSFNDDGSHNMSLIVNPSTAAKLRENPPTAEQEARMAEIIAEKRERWNAPPRRRDLP